MQASIEQVGSVIRDAEQKKKGKTKKVSIFMRLQFMTLLEMVFGHGSFVCLFVCVDPFYGSEGGEWVFDVCLESEKDGGFGC
jgi:hypothetical protein